MKVVFLSNYYNHHQKPFSDAMDSLTDHEYTFIATTQVSEWRKQLGYKDMEDPFVVQYKCNEAYCEELIEYADVVILGHAPYNLIKERLKKGKLTFLYTERLHKKGYNYTKLIKHIPQFYFMYGRYSNFFCLCASAFTAYDFSKTLTFRNKCLKWGYFPQTIHYESLDDLFKNKERDTVSLLYVSRLIDWKHPEYPLKLAKRLRDEGVKYRLTIIGTGEKEKECQNYIKDNTLEDYVSMIGAVSQDSVRRYMEKANIFLFTSDKNEGWGAVLNESMNSGCAVVASSAIGAAPFLISNRENGLIYKDGDFEGFYSTVKQLIKQRDYCRQLGEKAYKTIVEKWNADNAARSLIKVSDKLLNKEQIDIADGPCSKAVCLRDNWI